MKKIISFIIVLTLVLGNLVFVGAEMQSGITLEKNKTTSAYSYNLKPDDKGKIKGILGIPISVPSSGDVTVSYDMNVDDAFTLLTDVDILSTENPDTKTAINNGSYTGGIKKHDVDLDVAAAKTLYFYVFGGSGVTNDSKVTITVTHKDIIVPKAKIKKVKNVKKKKASITWSEMNRVDGFQLRYARNKGMTKSKKVVTIKDSMATNKTIKKLKKKKTYFFSIRAYRLVEKQPFYGAWSAVKKVKIKK